MASSGSSGLPEPMPQLVAFDLDYTLWDLWVDTHVTPPIKRKGDALNEVSDRRGYTFGFYRDVPSILTQLRHAKVHIAACSRTHTPERARQALDQLLIPASADPVAGKTGEPPIRSIVLFDTMEIYPGSKMAHFRALHEKTGIPYSEMVFYDDEPRNKEVSSLGVHFVLVPEGVNRRIFESGLASWRKARASGESGQVRRMDRSARV